MFPKPNWPTAPVPPYITQMYSFSPSLYPDLLKFTYKVDLKMLTSGKFIPKLQEFTKA